MTQAHADPSPPRTSRLKGATSPYLEAHADQPVDWYPWGEEALARARAEDKPIFLSIGYAACHWCHVMAHESFSDADIARRLNEDFISIKVDREERPDLDRIYQLSHQLLTGRGGGWPLSVFLTPDDQTPFFAGTYFPRDDRQGVPGFAQLLAKIVAYRAANRTAIAAQNGRLRDVLARLSNPAPAAGEADGRAFALAREQLGRAFDADYGGFSPAPKFPHTGLIERCLRTWSASAGSGEPDLQALYMAALTLTRMAEGGLYDHVGGGFARYSTDRYWAIPHFEKMLYDQALLIALYAQAATATGEALFRQAASGAADWTLAALGLPDGGFASSLDADSEGHEGAYYVWSEAQIAAAVPAGALAALRERFGLAGSPNFEGTHWHLCAARPVEDVARTLGTSTAAAQAAIADALAALKAARERREPPARDDKALTGWNGLMVRALALAARHLGRDDYAQAATRALDFARTRLWHAGRLSAMHRAGRRALDGYLDDYVFLADGALELLQVRYRREDLEFATALADAALAHFEDPDAGGFWFTAHDAPPLLARTKPLSDDSLPSGNGVAARVLIRLGHLLGEPRYLAAAQRTLRLAGSACAEQPLAHATLLDALEDWRIPPRIAILRGPAAQTAAWNRALVPVYDPHLYVLPLPDDAKGLPPALAVRTPLGRPVAYVCEGTTCSAPIADLAQLVRRLRDGIATGNAD